MTSGDQKLICWFFHGFDISICVWAARWHGDAILCSDWMVEVVAVKRILLVDDNPLILTSLAEAFANDYHVVTAASGEEAISILEVTPPGLPPFDLIITDLNMPGKNGYDLAGYVRERNTRNRFTPVIMLTSAEVTKEEARKYGCAACISKADMKKVVAMTHILLPR